MRGSANLRYCVHQAECLEDIISDEFDCARCISDMDRLEIQLLMKQLISKLDRLADKEEGVIYGKNF